MAKKHPGRPRKRGRPKGSRNKKKIVITAVTNSLKKGDILTFSDFPNSDKIGDLNLSTRLDKLMTEFETEMQRVMSKLKEMF